MRISDWSSDLCSSDLAHVGGVLAAKLQADADELAGGGALDRLAGLDRTGEVHLVGEPRADHLADLAVAHAEVGEEALRQPRLEIGRATGRERLGPYV